MARRLFVLLLLLLAPVCPVSADPLADEMAALLHSQGLTGATWALVTPEGTSIGAAGLADQAAGQAMMPQTRVQIGSVTKTLLATGVLRLVTLGRLSLDMPVADILPQVRFDNPWDATHPLRLRHLLDHTGGLDDARMWQVFSSLAGPDTPLIQGVAHAGEALTLRHPPGERFSYSNAGYTLLGMVVEAVVGERYETWMDRELLAPLSMRDSTFAFVTQAGPAADTTLAMGHFEGGVGQPAVPWFLRPAGQFTTSAADMALFARFLMGDGTVGGEPFIDTGLLRAMGRAEGTEAAKAGLQAGYALGLQYRDRHGVRGLCHSGNIVGYRAMFCLYPDQGRAFFLSVNADSETADYTRLDAAMVHALALPPAPVAEPVAGQDAVAWEGIYAPSPNRFAQFAYLDALTAALRVTATDQGLVLSNMQRADRLLLPLGGWFYRLADRTAASHLFLTAADGAAVLTDGGQSYQRIEPWRFWTGWVSVGFGLAGLSWLLLTGLWGLARGPRGLAGMLALAGILALVLPVPFLVFGQSFLELGDATLGSILLALVTGLLPVALLASLILGWRRRGVWVLADRIAILAALQWFVVLAHAGLLPLRLWV